MLEQSDIAHYLLSLGACQAARRRRGGPRRSSTRRAGTASSSPRRAPARRTSSSRPAPRTRRHAGARGRRAPRARRRAGAGGAGAHGRASRAARRRGSSCARPAGARDWSDHHGAGRFPRIPARVLGRTLAALHRLPADARRAAARASTAMWGLSLPEPPHELLLDLSAGAQDLVARVQASRALCDRLDELRDRRPTSALVHGDLRWDNCLALAAPGSRAQDARAAGRLGARRPRAPRRSTSAPCWPSTCAPGSARSRSSSPPIPAGCSARARHPLRRMQPAIAGLLVGVPARQPATARRSRRVIELAAVRLLQTAVERAQGLARAVGARRDAAAARRQHAPPSRRRGAGAAGAARVSRLSRPGRRGARGRDDPRADPLRLAGPREPAARRRRSTPSSTTPQRRSYLVVVPARGALRVVLLPRAARCRRAGASREPASPDPLARRGDVAGQRRARRAGSPAGRSSASRATRPSSRPRACARASRSATAARAGASDPGAAVSVRVPKELPALSPGLLHGRRATRPPTSRRRRASCACTGTSPAPAPPRSSARSPRGSMPRGRAVPAEGRRSPVPPRSLRRGGALPAGPTSSGAARTTLEDVAAALRRAPAAARSRPSRSSSRPAWGSPRTTAAARASACGAARCSPTAIVRAHEAGVTRTGARVDAVAARFAEDGVQIDAPYLRAVARRPPCPLTARSSTRPRRSAGASWPTRSGTTAAAAGSGAVVDPAQPWRARVPRARAEPLRRHRGRRPVPRAARRRDRRRGGAPHRRRRAAAGDRARAGAAARPPRRLPRRVARDRVGGRARRRAARRGASCARARAASPPSAPAARPRAACPDVDRWAAPARSSRCSRSPSSSTTRRWSRTRSRPATS